MVVTYFRLRFTSDPFSSSSHVRLFSHRFAFNGVTPVPHLSIVSMKAFSFCFLTERPEAALHNKGAVVFVCGRRYGGCGQSSVAEHEALVASLATVQWCETGGGGGSAFPLPPASCPAGPVNYKG